MTTTIPISQQLDPTWATMASTLISDNSNDSVDYLRVKPNQVNIKAQKETSDPISYKYIGDQFIDLSRSYFRGKCHIEKAGALVFTTASDSHLSIVNNPISAAFKEGTIEVGNQKPEVITNMPVVDNVLKAVSASKEWQNSQGFSDQLFYLDDASGLGVSAVSATTITVDPNAGLTAYQTSAPVVARRKRFFNGLANDLIVDASTPKTVSFVWKPCFGLFSGVTKPFYKAPLEITLNRSDPNTMFTVKSTFTPCVTGAGAHDASLAFGSTDIRLVFDELDLYLCKRTPSLELSVQLRSQMASAMTQYQYRTVQSGVIPVNTGSGLWAGTHNFGQKPRTIYIVTRKDGRDTPYANSAANDGLISRIWLQVNDKKYSVGSMNEMNMSYATGDYIDPLVAIRKLTDPTLASFATESLVTYDNFPTVHNIYAFDLSNSNTDEIPEMNRLSTRVEVNCEFTSAFAGKCYVIAVMEKCIEIQGIEGITNIIY